MIALVLVTFCASVAGDDRDVLAVVSLGPRARVASVTATVTPGTPTAFCQFHPKDEFLLRRLRLRQFCGGRAARFIGLLPSREHERPNNSDYCTYC